MHPYPSAATSWWRTAIARCSTTALLAGGSASTAQLSREHAVFHPAPGLVAVAGGKYTTYRVMAKDTIDEVARGLKEEAGLPVPPSVTAETPLLGADGYLAAWNRRARIAARAGLEVVQVEHLLHRHGSAIGEVLALVASSRSWPGRCPAPRSTWPPRPSTPLPTRAPCTSTTCWCDAPASPWRRPTGAGRRHPGVEVPGRGPWLDRGSASPRSGGLPVADPGRARGRDPTRRPVREYGMPPGRRRASPPC
jgi:hypothetical protein